MNIQDKVAVIATKALKEIKVTLGMEVKLEQMMSGDATLEAEAFEAGQPVFVVNGEDRVPVPEGEYELENGQVLVVMEEGVIAEVKDMAEAPAEEAEEEMEAEAPQPKKVVESVETHFSKDDLDAWKAELKAELLDALKQEFKNEGEVIEEIPASEGGIEAVKEADEVVEEKATELHKHTPKTKEKRMDFRSEGKTRKARLYSFTNKFINSNK